METTSPLRGRDYLQVDDLTADELGRLLDLADRLKAMQRQRRPHRLLPERSLAMIFERASTRTRVSFEVGMHQLGGSAVPLTAAQTQLGRGESLADTGRVHGAGDRGPNPAAEIAMQIAGRHAGAIAWSAQ